MADAVAGAVKQVNGSALVAADSYAAKTEIAPHFIGGKGIANAPPSKVKDFVLASGGHTSITNVRTIHRRKRRQRAASSAYQTQTQLTENRRFSSPTTVSPP